MAFAYKKGENMRNIFIVNAFIIDSNGTYNVLSGYPKNFDSNSYQNDIAKARKRADGHTDEYQV